MSRYYFPLAFFLHLLNVTGVLKTTQTTKQRSNNLVGHRADLIAKSDYIKGHDVVVFQEAFDSDPFGVLSGGIRSQCTS